MRTYALTFAALMALTALTFGLSFLHLGTWGIVIAMAIAAVKAGLVVLFFMHLVEHGNADRVAVGVALVLAASLIFVALVDVRSRASAQRTTNTTVSARAGVTGTCTASPTTAISRCSPTATESKV